MKVYGSISVSEKFMQKILQSHWISLIITACVPCWISGYHHVVGVYSFNSSGYVLPDFNYMWGFVSQAQAEYTWTRYFLWSMQTQVLCMVFQFRCVWMLVDLFKWESHLRSIDFWTVRNITWVDVDFAMRVILLVCTDAHSLLILLTSAVYRGYLISESIAYYVGENCKTRNQNFNVEYLYMVLTQFPSHTIDIAKV